LDKKVSEIFKLSKECVFVLNVRRDEGSLEFVYPPKLKGNLLPINSKSIAGSAVLNRRPYISNNVRLEKSFIVFDWIMDRGMTPIQKMISYPVLLTEKVISVIQITRRGDSLSEAGPDFDKSDLEKLSSILNSFLALQVVSSA